MWCWQNSLFPSPIYLSVSLHSESIAKNLFQYDRPLTKLLWDQRANGLWRLIGRKRSQIASFGLLHYLLLLPKTVLLMTSIHKSNLKHTSNKCSSEEDKSSAAHLGHREGEVVIKNWERTRKSIRKPSGIPALWRHQQLSTPLLCFPRSLCIAWGTATQVTTTTERSIAVWTEATCTNLNSPPEKYACTQGITIYSCADCILSREACKFEVCSNFVTTLTTVLFLSHCVTQYTVSKRASYWRNIISFLHLGT